MSSYQHDLHTYSTELAASVQQFKQQRPVGNTAALVHRIRVLRHVLHCLHCEPGMVHAVSKAAADARASLSGIPAEWFTPEAKAKWAALERAEDVLSKGTRIHYKLAQWLVNSLSAPDRDLRAAKARARGLLIPPRRT